MSTTRDEHQLLRNIAVQDDLRTGIQSSDWRDVMASLEAKGYVEVPKVQPMGARVPFVLTKDGEAAFLAGYGIPLPGNDGKLLVSGITQDDPRWVSGD